MKLRVRTPDGGTLRLEASADDSVGVLLSQALSAWSAGAEAAAAMLSLNKRDTLDEAATLRDSGVRGGDLLHLLSFGDVAMKGAEGGGAAGAAAGARAGGGGQCSAPVQEGAAPVRNPFGLPSSAPVGSAQPMVVDGVGRMWEETVTPSAASSAAASAPRLHQAAAAARQGSPETERLKRLRSIEQRMGLPAAAPPAQEQRQQPARASPEQHLAPAPAAPHSEEAGGGVAAQGSDDGALQERVEALVRREDVAGPTRAELCVLAMHYMLSQERFGNDELPTRWREGKCNFVLNYAAEIDGRRGKLTLKAVQILDRLMAYFFVGQGRARIGMPMRLSDYTLPDGGGLDGRSPSLIGGGRALAAGFRATVLSQLVQQSVTPCKVPSEAMDADAGGELDQLFVGHCDQRQFFAAFREGLRLCVETAAPPPLQPADVLVLGVHVLLCCAGLIPEKEATTPSPPSSPTGDTPMPLSPLDAAVTSLPPSWRGAPGCGCYSVRYTASVEGTESKVLMKALVLNGRLILHAHVKGGSSVAKCILRIGEIVHRVSGVPVITDDGLEKMVQMCSRRLLASVARMIRISTLHTALGSGLNGLYAELKTHILAHLPAKSLGLIASTNRKFNTIAMNDLLWEVLLLRDFGRSYVSEPASQRDGGDGTWRGTYRSLQRRRQQRRTAARQLFRVPFPLNPLAPWLPHVPAGPYGGPVAPRHGHPTIDPRFPMPWMGHYAAADRMGARDTALAPQARDVLRDLPLPRMTLPASAADRGSPERAPLRHAAHAAAAEGIEPLVQRGAATVLGVRGGGTCPFAGLGGGFRGF